jgi:Fe2+ or Zn2+ uptake regulation protein
VNWEKHLSAEGFRVTGPRRAIMQVLLAASIPVSPREILERGQRMRRKLGLVTVYRTLALLEQFDWVRRVHREDGCHAYLPASPGHSHALICRACGHAVDFGGGDDLDTLIERVEAGTGYCVNDHLLQLFGLCPDCQETRV